MFAWCWDAGTDAPASNTDGSITTTVKTNGKFSIATWQTPAGVGTIGTGLPSADFVIIKTTNITGNWYVWHKTEVRSYLPLNGQTEVSMVHLFWRWCHWWRIGILGGSG